MERKICHGCLCDDTRKITAIHDNMKHWFLQTYWELPKNTYPNEIDVFLCWECDYQLRKFYKFKCRAQESRKFLQKYSSGSSQILTYPQNLSSLASRTVFNITIPPKTDNEVESEAVSFEVIKTEDTDINYTYIYCIKQEEVFEITEHSDNNYSDDDNQLLIEIRSQKKKQKEHVKKKRKKKHKDQPTKELEVSNFKEIELTQEEIEEERRLMALKEEYVNALFKCEKCIVSFPNADDLKDHIHIKHELNSSLHVCPICTCSFSCVVSLVAHGARHTRRLQCAACDQRFYGRWAATKHYDTVHCVKTDLDYDLNRISRKNRETKETELNNGTKEDTPSFPCEFCEKTFRWKTSLRKHTETHRIESGQKRRPYCETCRLSFTTTSSLQKHVTSSKHQIQLKLRKLKDTLPEDATNPEKAQAHIDEIKSGINSGRQLYTCSQCDRRFQWRGNLIRHLHSHAARANGELVCEPCNRTFSSIATYKQHMKISKKHNSESDFKYICSDCGKRFVSKTKLKDHVDWEHLKNYVHKCPVCQKVFKCHTSLYLHKQVVHTKDNAEHLCDHCGKPFPNRGKLRSHIQALHSSEAAFTCNICGARFGWHSCLSRHVRRVHKNRDN